jgi:hypothetical protein
MLWGYIDFSKRCRHFRISRPSMSPEIGGGSITLMRQVHFQDTRLTTYPGDGDGLQFPGALVAARFPPTPVLQSQELLGLAHVVSLLGKEILNGKTLDALPHTGW